MVRSCLTHVAALATLVAATGCAVTPPSAEQAAPPTPTPTDANSTVLPATAPAARTALEESAANADVEFVRAVLSSDGTWTFEVTVRHPDTGWEDYADGWDVVLPDGSVVKPDPDNPFTRLLLHPHETEQPFTRSQSGIVIPPGVTRVTVRAHDLVDGWGGREVAVDIAAASGPDFEVKQ